MKQKNERNIERKRSRAHTHSEEKCKTKRKWGSNFQNAKEQKWQQRRNDSHFRSYVYVYIEQQHHTNTVLSERAHTYRERESERQTRAQRIAHFIVFRLAQNMRCQWITTWCTHIIDAREKEKDREFR